MTRLALWLTTALSLFVSVQLIQPARVQARPEPAQIALASELIAEVNALRAANGLPAYNSDPILMQVAQAHADYQASIGTTTHYSADGSRPFQRALAAGYAVAGDLARGGYFSENITSGSGKSPAQAVREWQRDAAHMNTMLSPYLQDIGAGVTLAHGVTYYTLDAGLSSGSTVIYTPPVGGTLDQLDALPPLEIVQPVATTTALADGSVFHEVRIGQALWSIALAYGTTIDELKRLNELTTNEIYVGQKLLVQSEESLTGTPAAPTVTVTAGAPSPTPTELTPPTPPPTATPRPVAPATWQSSGITVAAIVAGALLAAGIGTWLGQKRSTGQGG